MGIEEFVHLLSCARGISKIFFLCQGAGAMKLSIICSYKAEIPGREFFMVALVKMLKKKGQDLFRLGG